MKNFQEWLGEFKEEIEKGYQSRTMKMALAKHVSEVEKRPNVFLKYDGPMKASTATTNTEISMNLVSVRISTRNVTPINAGISVDLKDWADDPDSWGMNVLMQQCGEMLAEREYAIILEGMKNCAGHTTKVEKEGILSKDDITNATNWIMEQGVYADSIVMPLEQKTRFMKSNDLFDAFRLPLGWNQERRTVYYAGLIGATNAYWARFIKNYALVFAQEEMFFESTPLKIEFDSMTHPKKLFTEKWCASAPLFDQAVVKIDL